MPRVITEKHSLLCEAPPRQDFDEKQKKKTQSHSIQHTSIIHGSNKAAAKVPKQVMCSRTGLSSGRMNKSVSSWTVGSEANLQLASKEMQLVYHIYLSDILLQQQ